MFGQTNRSMQVIKAFYTFILVQAILVLFLCSSGCIKDYSYEYRPADSSSAIIDTVTPLQTGCEVCRSAALPDLSWRFTIDNTIYCGKAEKALVAPGRTGFTFFGPSFCSVDSGFVVTVYLNNVQLTGDMTSTNARMSCYYYDKIGPSSVYVSTAGEPLQIHITSYSQQTGIATGTFAGGVVDRAGRRRKVKDGRFHIRM